jgi:adenylate cyclase class 2
MQEIEVKILEIDPKKVVAKLKELGTKKVEAGMVSVTAFDFPDDRLMKKGSYIRVRTFGHRNELVLKTYEEQKEFRTMDEIETTVGDYNTTLKLFDALGMKVFAKHEKYRATYVIGSMKFELDKYPTMPWFVEVEAPSKEDVEKGVKMLGFDMSRATSRSGAEFFRSYGLGNFFTFKEKGEKPDYDMIFR